MKKLLLLILTWWQGQTVGAWLHTKLHGEFVGEDEARSMLKGYATRDEVLGAAKQR